MEMHKYTHLLQKGDIILVYNKKSFLHKIICFITRKESSGYKAGHVILYLFGNMIADASFRGVSESSAPKFSKSKYNLYIARYKNNNNTIENKIINIALAKAGKKDTLV